MPKNEVNPVLTEDELKKLNVFSASGDISSFGKKEDTAYTDMTRDRITVSRIESDDEMCLIHDFTLIYVTNGSCKIVMQRKSIIMRESDLIIICPDTVYKIENTENCTSIAIQISKDLFIHDLFRVFQYHSPVTFFITSCMWGERASCYVYFHGTGSVYLHRLLEMIIYEEVYPNDYSKILKTGLLISIIGYLSEYDKKSYEISKIGTRKSEQIPRIIGFINENYRSVTLESLAAHFHYTVPYVSKLIKTATGMTFTEILREIKFEVCCSLLENSDLKINRIAEIAGYQNTDHFNRIFKKRTGLTPSDYKRDKQINTVLDNE